MKALLTTKRPTLFLISLLLLLTADSALAKDAEHGYLGVMLQNISSSMAKALQLDEGQGVLINKVVDDGPAAKSGLEDGDVILKFNGKAIGEYSDLTKAVRGTAPGDNVALEILHNGKPQTTHVKMGEGDGGEHKVIVIDDDDDDFTWTDGDDVMKSIRIKMLGRDEDRGFMGVELDDLNEQLGEYFGVPDGEGALISRVNEDSPAAKAGFKAGDVIVKVNGEEIDDSGDVHEAMAETSPEQEIKVRIVRKGKQKTMKVTLGKMPKGSSGPHMMHFGHNDDFDFPVGLRHKMLRLHEDNGNLSEVREELDKLREELNELKAELRK